jgi:uncharacterized membrane protein
MAFCSKCGSNVSDGQGFCPNCGAPAGAAAPPPQYSAVPPQQYAAAPASDGLQENVAGLLCYLAGFITGIIFLLIDKRPNVRFHAAQSIVFFGGCFVLQFVLGIFGHSLLGLIIFPILSLLWLLEIVAWIVLMIMAYQGKRFEIPVVAGIARSLVGKV